MDLVVNHTSDEHPWFIESRSSQDSPKRDWYWWRPSRAHMEPGASGAEPTNWGSSFSGPAWDLDERTGQYYLHLFSRKQPDLNWENPQVRAAIYSMMRWWLDRGVDGFRMDVINFISKAVDADGSLPDGIVRDGALFGDGRPHFVCGPRIHEFLQEMHQEVFAGRPELPLTVGEMPGVTVEEAVLFTDPARGEVDMVFQFEHVDLDRGAGRWDVRPLRLTDLKESFGRWQAGLADLGWNSLYWNNHDQPRVVSRFGDDGQFRERSATMLATVLHLHRGTPFIYQGEELGMTNAHFERIDQYRDIESVNHYAEARAHGQADEGSLLEALRAVSRDNARTPVQWDTTENAGFTTGEPWIAVNPNYPEINAAEQHDNPSSVFHYYRSLITLRHAEPAVALGDFTMLMPDDEAVYAFLRRHGQTELLVLGNFSPEPRPVLISDPAAWTGAQRVLCNIHSGAVTGASNLPELQPWEARVYRRQVG